MRCGLGYLRPMLDHLSVGTDHHGGPDRAFHFLAVHHFFAPRIVVRHHLLIGVGEQYEIQIVVGYEVVIEFNGLQYMNSSTVPPIIQLIKLLNENEVETLITYSKEAKWQLASFKALEKLSLLMEHITVKGI